jgi:ABC-type glycerol-3-phosphate transport system permease component
MTNETIPSPTAAPNGFWASKRRTEKITKIIVTILLVAGSLVMMLPIFWMLSTSFKANEDVFAVHFSWIPNPLRFQNYPDAWTLSGRGADEDWSFLGIPFHGVTFTTYLVNTLTIAVLSCVGTTLSSSLVAFAFARLRFPMRGALFLLCLATMMVPTQVTMIPTFILFTSLGWYNTLYPLIVPAFLGGGAYNIFLMRQFFMSIPYEMDEAAKIDGCSNFGVYWRILLPLCKPALTTVAVFSFVYNWNDYLNPLIYLSDDSKRTLALGLTNFVSLYGAHYELLMAAALIISLPIALMFLIGQRYFIQGIATTGLK